MLRSIMKRASQSELVRSAFLFYLVPFLFVTNKRLIGNTIFEHEWDVCIVLDACRADTFETIAEEFDRLSDAEIGNTMWSVGSNSPEWIQNTFRQDVLTYQQKQNITYLSANGYINLLKKPEQAYKNYGAVTSESQLNSDYIKNLISRSLIHARELDNSQFIEPHSPPPGYTVTPPEEMTDAVLSYIESENPDKLITHFMQPHAPYFSSKQDWTPDSIDRDPINAARNGYKNEAYDRYRETLRVTLSAVERLLNGLSNSTVLITADHGELFGEFGLYGHMPGFPHSALRRVPAVTVESGTRKAVELKSRDSWNFSDSSDNINSSDISNQLESLGYK